MLDRGMLFSAESGDKKLSNFISGIILNDETFRQTSESGETYVELIKNRGILPGIKVITQIHFIVIFLARTCNAVCWHCFYLGLAASGVIHVQPLICRILTPIMLYTCSWIWVWFLYRVLITSSPHKGSITYLRGAKSIRS